MWADSGNAVSEVFDSEFMAKLERLSFRSRRTFSSISQGASRTSRLGASVEFSDLRRYSPGDDFRYIDWNAFARLDELFLKLFHEEGDVCVYLLVDASASMGFGTPSKLVYSERLAAAMAYVALTNLDRASVVMLRGGGCEGLPLLKGKKQIFRVFNFLKNQEPRGRTSLHQAIRTFGAEARHTGHVVLLSDLMDESDVMQGLRRLKYLGFETQVIHILSPDEMDPQFEPGVTLSDSETGEEISSVDVSAYAGERSAFIESMKKQCAETGIPYLYTSTDIPFGDVVLR